MSLLKLLSYRSANLYKRKKNTYIPSNCLLQLLPLNVIEKNGIQNVKNVDDVCVLQKQENLEMYFHSLLLSGFCWYDKGFYSGILI